MNTKLTTISALISGTVFALGLGISGMTKPEKVVAFLDISGDWDPSLAFVMVGAIGVYAVLYRLIIRRSAPVLDDTFHLPTATRIDPRLIIGASLFGIGWGIGGFCPGPAIASVASLQSDVLIFVASMGAGMALWGFLRPRSETP